MQEDPTPKRPSTFPLFSKHLVLQPNSVLQFASESRKQFDDFVDAFRKRIVVENDYANNLMAVARSLDRYIERGTDKSISFICSAFQVENEQRAHQARQLAENLKTEIFQICLNLSKEEANIFKKVERDVKNLIKRYESVNQNLKLSALNYEKSNEKYDELIITKSYLTHTNTLPQQKKSKHLQKQFLINEEQLPQQMSTNRYSDTILVSQGLNQIQAQIREHIVLEADCLRKLIVAEVSMFKNIEYDLINISKQMEVLDTQKDLEIACNHAQLQYQNLIIDPTQENPISDSKENKQKKKEASFVSNDKDDHKKLKTKPIQLAKGMLAKSISNIQEEKFTKLILHKKSKPFNQMIQIRWNQLGSKVQAQQKEHKQNLKNTFDEYFKDSNSCQQLVSGKKQEDQQEVKSQILENFVILTRFIHEVWNGDKITPLESKKKSKSVDSVKDLTMVFVKRLFSSSHFYRLVAYSFIQCFKTHHCVQIDSQERVQEISKLLNNLLTKSYKQNDVFVLRGLLFLLFTFYYIENNTKRHMASEPSIYKNSLWKKPDFWDAAIFESTYEEMLNFNPQNESLQQNSVIEKNLLFSQLAMFCHYMIMLGISSQNVRQIVGRFCKLYSMTDQQNRDLSKMITNTVKQYKEIILVNLKNNNKDSKDQNSEKSQASKIKDNEVKEQKQSKNTDL